MKDNDMYQWWRFLYSFVNEYCFVESWHGENEEELYPPTWKVFELFYI